MWLPVHEVRVEEKKNTRQLAYFCPTSFLTVRPLQSFFSNCLVTTHNHNWDQFYISFGVSRQLEVKSHRASCVRISTAILVLFESLVNLSPLSPIYCFLQFCLVQDRRYRQPTSVQVMFWVILITSPLLVDWDLLHNSSGAWHSSQVWTERTLLPSPNPATVPDPHPAASCSSGLNTGFYS